MFSKYRKIRFPFWQYLNQPIFTSEFNTVLNPRRFWRIHRIDLLERCLMKECTSNKDY